MANDIPLTVTGNLTDTPDLRYSANGVAIAKFTLANTPRTYDKTKGEWVDAEPTFMNCTAFRELAEHLAESLAKGARVIVTGRLKQSHWTTDEGQKRSAFSLDVEEAGPSLRFATAQVKKMTRTGGNNVAPDDTWATATRTRPTSPAPAGAGGFDEKPPF